MSGPVIIAELTKNKRERVRVALDQYQGHNLVDVRVTTQLNVETDDWIATKKGISCQVAMLPDLVVALQAAEAKARELGLIEGGGK